jgi:hypothetical protein
LFAVPGGSSGGFGTRQTYCTVLQKFNKNNSPT